jgi:hypothetical protein
MRKLLILSLSALVVGVIGGAAAPGAGALTQVTCNGLNSVTYSPAVTNTPGTTTISSSSTFAPCLSLTNPSIVAGAIASTVTTTASCTTLLGSFSATNVITWNTGQTSTLVGNAYTERVDGQPVVLVLGSIVSGLFRGATVTQQTVLTGDLSGCLGSGLTGTSGPAVLTIVGL